MEGNLGGASPQRNFEYVMQRETVHPNSIVDAERICQHLRALSPGDKFLDVGAGYGFFSKAAQRKGFRVTAMEPNEQCREIFKYMNGFEAKNSLLDSNFVSQNRGKYDVILLSQLLEHIPIDTDPVSKIRTLLSQDGVCAVAVPHFRSVISLLQGKRDMFICPPEHLNFFTIGGLTALFERNGFGHIQHETISRFERKRVFSKVRVRFAAGVLANLLGAVLDASDRVDKGMIINAYFRKN